MTDHKIVNHDEWTAARDELLALEKQHTKRGDELVLAIIEIRVRRSSNVAFGGHRFSRFAIIESRGWRADVPSGVRLAVTSLG
jgi:hypothetical protein